MITRTSTIDSQRSPYFLRSKELVAAVQSSNSDNMSVTLSDDQFEALLSRLSIPPNTTVVSSTSGNFSKCNSRFDGSKDSDVNAFIDAIEVYKDCTNISEENALRGLPMLLDGFAATWFQGVKSSLTDWNRALALLRTTFGPTKPPYRVYRDLFAQEQDAKTKCDVYICKARAILAQLPTGTLTEATQIDMIYGLLHRRVREKVPRDKVASFEELLTQARLAEETFDITVSRYEDNHTSAAKEKPVRCAYCKNPGHLKEECRKLKHYQDRRSETSSTQLQQTTTKLTTPKTATTASAPPYNNSTIVCYGCGTPGFIRSNCPKCSVDSNRNGVSKESVASAEFLCSSFTKDNCSRPLVPIAILKHAGYAYLDTGATTNIAGSKLTQILIEEHVPYLEANDLDMVLADGAKRKVQALIFNVPVTLYGRTAHVQLLSIPDHINSRTLLGADFIRTMKLVLDLNNNVFHFSDCSDVAYQFTTEGDVAHVVVNTVDLSNALRSDEALKLRPEERQQLDHLLQEFSTLFKLSNEPTPFAEHRIVLQDDTPIAVPPYRISIEKKQQLRKELDILLENGTIEECESPYAAPVVLVPKKDGGIRLTVDYRRLNAITRADRYPLPRIDDLLHDAKKTKYMTTLDLKSGYHQISVRPSDRDKTGFVTPFGTFRYTRMPFGLVTAPSTFQRLMDRFKSGLTDVALLVYLDDLIVLSSSFSEHLSDLRQVFARLNLFKLKLNRAKCHLCLESVKYLGHILSPEGIHPDNAKVAAIMDMPAPTNVKQLLSFLQTCSWFRRFIEGFAQVAKPLTSLTKKDAKWEWKTPQVKAFEKLKLLLSSAPILRQADPRLPYTLRTDASSYALGACLLQGEGEDERPVEYASRLLTPAEQNYSTTEREALAVVWSVQKFRGYIENSTVNVQSDHQPLKWLLSLKTPTGRLARWALSLQAQDLRIDYISGKKNVIADTLSRPPREVAEATTNLVSVELPTMSAKDIREQQMADPDTSKIIVGLEDTPNGIDFKKWADRGYLMSNGVLYRYNPDIDEEEPQLVIAASGIPEVLHEYHDTPTAGHYGIERTYQRIARRFYWPGMRKAITEHVGRCIECQRFKATNLKPAGLLQTPIQSQRFEVIAIDLFGPLPETPTGQRWIFIIEDTTSRWTEIFPLKTATAEACARCLIDEIVLRYGVPRKVISDNGVQFVTAVMQQVAHVLGFKQCLTPVYHPESNPVERKNRDMKSQLAILTSTDHTVWDEKIPSIRFAMNTAKCESTGYSPAYLTFGRELRSPDDVHRDLRAIIQNDNFVPQVTPYLLTMQTALQEARESHEKNQDRRTNLKNEGRRDSAFNVGEKVLIDSHILSNASKQFTSKFAPRRDGPYRIHKIVSPTTYIVTPMDQPDQPVGKYHVSALTRYKEPTSEGIVPMLPIRKRGRPPGRDKQQAETEARTVTESMNPNEDPIGENGDEVPVSPRSEDDTNQTPPSTEGRAQRKPVKKKCLCCA